MATNSKKADSKAKALASKLSKVSAQAKSLGINTAKADSMVAQTKREGSKSYKGSREEKAFLASDIGTTSPVIPPKPVPTDTGDMLGMNNASVLQEGLTLDGGQFVKDPNASDVMNATKEANANIGNIASQVLGYLQPQENQMQNAYEDTYGITSRQAGREYRRAQQDVQQYTSQLNSITSSRDAAVLALEDTGRGQTSGFIGGEQGRIQRQAAIAALPVQAQLAAAQGNLEIAKSHVDSLFQMKIKDIETEQAYKNTVANTWMSVANQQQSNLLNAAIADSNARAEAKKIAMNDAKQIAMQAIEYGQSSLAASVMKLDPTSKTYQQDVMNAMAGLRKPATSTKRETQVVGDKLIDMQTGEVISDFSKSPVNDYSTPEGARQYETQKADIQMGYNTATKLLENKTGLNLSTGAYQSPAMATLLKNVGGSVAGFGAAGTVVPGIGTVAGLATGLGVGLVTAPSAYSYNRTQKDQFLADTSFLINDSTFAEIRDMKAQGVTFGNMTEGERIAAGRAATNLASAAIIDESGMVTGFRGSADNIEKYIRDIQTAYEGRQEYLDKQYAITQDDEDEAATLWGGGN